MSDLARLIKLGLAKIENAEDEEAGIRRGLELHGLIRLFVDRVPDLTDEEREVIDSADEYLSTEIFKIDPGSCGQEAGAEGGR